MLRARRIYLVELRKYGARGLTNRFFSCAESDEDMREEALEIVRCVRGYDVGEVSEGCRSDRGGIGKGYPCAGEEGREGERGTQEQGGGEEFFYIGAIGGCYCDRVNLGDYIVFGWGCEERGICEFTGDEGPRVDSHGS